MSDNTPSSSILSTSMHSTTTTTTTAIMGCPSATTSALEESERLPNMTSAKRPRKPAPPPKIGLRLRAQLFEDDNDAQLLIPPPQAPRPHAQHVPANGEISWRKQQLVPQSVSIFQPPPTPDRSKKDGCGDGLSSPFSPMEESQGSTPDNTSTNHHQHSIGGSAVKPCRTSGLTSMFEAAISAPSSPAVPPTPQEKSKQRKKRPYVGGLYGRPPNTETARAYANENFEPSPWHSHHHRNVGGGGNSSLWMGPKPVRRTAPFNPFSPKPPADAMEDDAASGGDLTEGGGAPGSSNLPPSIFFPRFYGGQARHQPPTSLVGTYSSKSFDSTDGDTQTTLSTSDDNTTLSPLKNAPPPTPLAPRHPMLLNGGFPARHGRYSFTGSPIEEMDGDFGYGQSKMRRLTVHSDNESQSSPMTSSTTAEPEDDNIPSSITDARSGVDRRAKFALSRRLMVDCQDRHDDGINGAVGTESFRHLNIPNEDMGNNNDEISPTDVAHFPEEQPPPPRTPFKAKSAVSRTPLKDNRNFASSTSPLQEKEQQPPEQGKENLEPPGAPRIPRRSYGSSNDEHYRRPVYFFADGYGTNVASSDDEDDHNEDDTGTSGQFKIRRGPQNFPVSGAGANAHEEPAQATSPNVGMSMANNHTSAAPPPPSRFTTDFEVVGTLGAGSFGTVYKCLSKLDGCLYAVKAAKRAAKGIADRDRMLKEVYALAALCDQSDTTAAFHIVRYHQAWMEDNRLYIQTELCSSTLQDQVSRGKMASVDRRYRLLREMLLALELLHKNDMVHLDIKPENIFLKNDQFKLGDFGLVNKKTSMDIEEGDSRYMSLELLSGDHSDLTKSDIFSLGASLFEICRGRPLPMDGPEWQALRAGQLALDDKNFLRTTPPELLHLIADMMNPDPSKRPTASELLTRPQLLSDEQKLLRAEKAKVFEANRALALQEKILKRLTPPRKKLTRSNTWNGGSTVL